MMALYIIVVVLVGLVVWQINRSTTGRIEGIVADRCEATNLGRREGNKRGQIMREFLGTAAQTRLATALKATDPVERSINQRAADRYNELATQIEDYPYLDCDGDGEADKP